MLAQQVSGYWRRLRRRIWPARMRACCAKPDQDRSVEGENPRGALPAPPRVSDPRAMDAFMTMRGC